jgi:hypothetical protein
MGLVVMHCHFLRRDEKLNLFHPTKRSSTYTGPLYYFPSTILILTINTDTFAVIRHPWTEPSVNTTTGVHEGWLRNAGRLYDSANDQFIRDVMNQESKAICGLGWISLLSGFLRRLMVGPFETRTVDHTSCKWKTCHRTLANGTPRHLDYLRWPVHRQNAAP